MPWTKVVSKDQLHYCCPPGRRERKRLGAIEGSKWICSECGKCWVWDRVESMDPLGGPFSSKPKWTIDDDPSLSIPEFAPTQQSSTPGCSPPRIAFLKPPPLIYEARWLPFTDLFGSDHIWAEIEHWCEGEIYITPGVEPENTMILQTPRGEVRAPPGSWILKDVREGFWVAEKANFSSSRGD